MDCPCGSGNAYEKCCAPFIKGESHPESAEQLMRSRYSAYAMQEIPYIHDTIHPNSRKDWDEEGQGSGQNPPYGTGLKLFKPKREASGMSGGRWEFIARFTMGDDRLQHHERADFEKIAGRWYFKDGELVKPKQVKREAPKMGRNDPCPCGSGKKYKKCCGK